MLNASCFVEVAMPRRFDLRCGAGKTVVLLPLREGEHENSLAGYLAPLRQTLIDNNERHVNVIVCESDYRALKRGIEDLPPGMQ
jgi:hypothetical protein